MATEYFTLGSTPCDTPCEQIGPNFDGLRARLEMTAYIEQLKRQFPKWEEVGVRFKTKSFPHDFGSYSEVCIFFDDTDEAQIDFANEVESHLPEIWDEISTTKLTENCYFK